MTQSFLVTNRTQRSILDINNQQLEEGRIKIEKYDDWKLLGIGGFGVTYTAIEKNTGKKVVIKAIDIDTSLSFGLSISDIINEAKISLALSSEPSCNEYIVCTKDYFRAMWIKPTLQFSGSGFNSQPGAFNTQPGAFNTQPGAFNTQPGVLNSQSGAFNTQPGAFNTQPGAFNTQPGAFNTQPGAFNTQPGAFNTQPGAFNTQPAAFNTQPGAFNTQSGAFNTQPSAFNTQPAAFNTQPGALNSQSGAFNTQPGALNSQSGAFNTQPGALNSQSGALNSQSGALNSQSGVLNSQLGVFNISTLASNIPNISSIQGNGLSPSQINSIGEPKDTFFIVSEYIDSGPDMFLINTRNKDPTQLLSYFYQLAAGLSYIHSLGYAHRDIKSDNVKYDVSTGRYKYIDFGLSCSTGCQTTKGSLSYQPPESRLGIPGIEAAQAHDIWSLGVMMFSLANSQLPYDLHEWDLYLENKGYIPQLYLSNYTLSTPIINNATNYTINSMLSPYWRLRSTARMITKQVEDMLYSMYPCYINGVPPNNWINVITRIDSKSPEEKTQYIYNTCQTFGGNY